MKEIASKEEVFFFPAGKGNFTNCPILTFQRAAKKGETRRKKKKKWHFSVLASLCSLPRARLELCWREWRKKGLNSSVREEMEKWTQRWQTEEKKRKKVLGFFLSFPIQSFRLLVCVYCAE